MKKNMKKRSKLISLLMVFMMLFTMMPSMAFADGETTDVIEISDQAGLAAIKNGGSYKLVADITLDDGWDPKLGNRNQWSIPFTLDGNGHVIDLNGKTQCLFNTILSGDKVVNLFVTGATKGSTNVAGIAQSCKGIIRNCISTVTLNVEASGLPQEYCYAGGVAVNGDGTIANCYSAAVLPTEFTNVGKIIGVSNSCTVTNCYTDADNIDTVITALNESLLDGDLTWANESDTIVLKASSSGGDNEGGNGDDAFSGEGEEPGDITTPEEPAEGYTAIRTQADLANLATTGKYQLMNDITLENWTSIVTVPDGTEFNGNGYTITLSGKPLCETMKGKVVNLKLAGQVTETGTKNTGALCQSLSGGTVHNCISDVAVTYNGTSSFAYVGQLNGTFNGSATVTNCLLLGSLTQGNASCNGALGASYNNPKEFSNCVAIGYTALATKEGYPTNSAISGTNCILVEVGSYNQADYLDRFNSNRGDGLEWEIKDGALSLKRAAGGTAQPTDPDATEDEITALNDAIIAAESVDTKTTVYTADSYTAFNNALTVANNVIIAESKKQSEVTQATADLTTAVESLTERNLEPVDFSNKDVISITTADELENMQDGKYYRLDADITLGQYWFGYYYTMNSVLDGNGHTITMIGKPLWSAIGPNGVVQNLGVLGTAQNSQNDTGAFAKDCEGLIVNCWSQAQVSSAGQNNYRKNTGGFVANLKSGGAVVNSYVAGSVVMNGSESTGVQGVFAGTTEANTMIKNGYWLSTVSGDEVGSGDAIVTGCAAKSRADFYSNEFISLLNAGKGNNGKAWTINNQGWPHLGEDAGYEPPAPIELVYTAYEGYGSGTTTFIAQEGLLMSLAEVLPDPDAEITYYVGQFSYPDFDGEAVFVPQYAANGQGNHKVFASAEGELQVLAAGTLEIAVCDKASWSGTQYEKELTRFTVTVSDIEAEDVRLVPSGEHVTEKADGTYEVAGSAVVSLNTEIKVDGLWRSAPSSLFTFTETGAMRRVGSSLYATEPGDITVTASYKDKSGTVNITSTYVPVTSIAPAPNGKYIIHGRNANTSGSAQFLDLTLANDAGTVVVLPENASYRDRWTLSSSDESIAYYGTSYMMAVIPVKAGKVTLTATSTDPGLETEVKGTSEIELEYFNPLTSITIEKNKFSLKENESIELPLTFTGPKNEDGYHVSEPGIIWSFSGDGEVEITREPLGVIIGAEGGKEYCIANDEYELVGIASGTVNVTGTPIDTTSGAEPISFTVTVAEGKPEEAADNVKIVKDGIKLAQDYLQKNNASREFAFGDEWLVLALERSGSTIAPEKLEGYVSSVANTYAETDESELKPTTLARTVLALEAIGEDATNVNGVNLVEKLYNNARIANGGNEAMWSLIAIDSAGFTIPDNAVWTRDKLIDEILEYQAANGGFAWESKSGAPDVDTTAMALQALAPYNTTENVNVQKAINDALEYLKTGMNRNCQYSSSEPSAQVLIALSALGKDALDEENGFVKSVARNLITGLDAYKIEGKGFKHLLTDKDENAMATLQALQGFEAYRRFAAGEAALYDFSDVKPGISLAKRIAEAEAMEADKSYYPADLWAAMEEKLAEAKLINTEIADENTIKAADEALAAAIAALHAASPTPGVAAEDIDVYVTIAKAGWLVTAMDGTLVGDAKVTVVDRDKNGRHTIDEALYAAHEKYFEGGAAEGYGSNNGLSLTKLWGDISGSFGYWQNNAPANGPVDSVVANSYLTAYVYKDTTTYSDSYSKFDKETFTTTINSEVTLTLEKAGYDADRNVVFSPYEGANIKVVGETADRTITTAEGKAVLTFTKAGTYKVIAYKEDGSIVPSVATVKVTDPSVATEKVYLRVADPAGKTYLSKTGYDFELGETALSLLLGSGLDVETQYYAVYGSHYVKAIEGLGEFDGGAQSGWMYKVNGIAPNYGASSYMLKAGDYVEWLYTRNLGTDLGIKPDEKNEVTTGVVGASGVIITTTPTEVTVSGSNATATVTKENVTETLKQATENKASEIVLQVSANDTKGAATIKVQLDTQAVKDIAEDTTAALTVKTELGNLTLDRETLTKVAADAKGKMVEFSFAKNEDGTVQVSVVSGDAVLYTDVLGEDETMTAEEVKALLADLTPVARSSKTPNKNTKVTVKLDKADKAIIEELEAEGFTVKYNFYRSTKKSSKYKSMLIKSGKSYTNTKGKKGQMYYYKVRVQVYDADGKLVARTALKDCKYANRKWTK